MSDNDVQIIRPPNTLRARVSETGGVNIDSIVAEAQANLAGLQEEFDVWLRADLKKIDEAYHELRKADPAAPEAMAQISLLLHELKGQGATFGYPLVSALCAPLCRFLENEPEKARRQRALIGAHIDAIHHIVSHEIKTADDPAGRQLIEALAGAIARVAGR